MLLRMMLMRRQKKTHRSVRCLIALVEEKQTNEKCIQSLISIEDKMMIMMNEIFCFYRSKG
jgi:hypothetical protein